jgi:hypothetical protein
VIYIIAVGVVAIVFIVWLVRMFIKGRRLRGMRAWTPPPRIPRQVDEEDETKTWPGEYPNCRCATYPVDEDDTKTWPALPGDEL